jgi:hypothetical protein
MTKYVGPAPSDPQDIATKGYVDGGTSPATLKQYANMTALDAVTETESGFITIANLGTTLGWPSLNGMSGKAVVETSVTFEGTYYGAIQTATLFDPNNAALVERSRARYTAGLGAWGSWESWITKPYPYASQGSAGMIRTATDAEATGMASIARAITPSNLDAIATSSPNPSLLMRRNASGRAQVVDPSAAADIATKNYVDLRTPGILVIENGAAVPGGTPVGTIIIEKSA